MSSFSVPLSVLESSLLQSIVATPSKTSTTAALASSAGTDATGGSSTGNSVTPVTRDFSSFLKALSQGDSTEAEEILAQLQNDQRAEHIVPSTQVAGSAQSGPSANDIASLFSELSATLSGSTNSAAAIRAVAAYLVSIGAGKGNLVDTYV